MLDVRRMVFLYMHEACSHGRNQSLQSQEKSLDRAGGLGGVVGLEQRWGEMAVVTNEAILAGRENWALKGSFSWFFLASSFSPRRRELKWSHPHARPALLFDCPYSTSTVQEYLSQALNRDRRIVEALHCSIASQPRFFRVPYSAKTSTASSKPPLCQTSIHKHRHNISPTARQQFSNEAFTTLSDPYNDSKIPPLPSRVGGSVDRPAG